MIKKYFDFIKESSLEPIDKFHSLGEWVEYLYDFYKNDEEKLSNLKSIVNRKFNVKGEKSNIAMHAITIDIYHFLELDDSFLNDCDKNGSRDVTVFKLV